LSIGKGSSDANDQTLWLVANLSQVRNKIAGGVNPFWYFVRRADFFRWRRVAVGYPEFWSRKCHTGKGLIAIVARGAGNFHKLSAATNDNV
jgi:hypothetical protein